MLRDDPVENAKRWHVSRRAVLTGAAMTGVSCLLPVRSPQAQQGAGPVFEPPSHGLSVFGDLKYPNDFKYFDYVKPDAPKGGEFSVQIGSLSGNQNFTTYDTLNIYSMRGNGAAGMGLIYDSLMMGSLDESDSLYGLVAESVQRSTDGLLYRFKLRPQARFHNGSPLTAEDVVFSLETLKSPKAHATYRLVLDRVLGATAIAPDLVEIRFAPGRSRELPLIAASLPIFSKAYYATRDFDAGTLEIPVGSGGYKVDKVDVGRAITFRRVADYWAKDLPVSVGQGNFETVRYEYFRDREAAFQAFTAGAFTFREEHTSVFWATRYDFPAVRDGRVKRETALDGRPSGTQGWFLNTRRPQFRDARVREAMALALDFEWVNRNLMYGLLKRTSSYFENSPMKAEGKPSAAELALLEPHRGKVPDEVFGEPWTPPTSDGSGQDRAILRRASQLLAAAGAKRGPDNILVLPDGTKMQVEFLEFDNSLNRHSEAVIKNLRLLGIEGSIRVIDPSQFQRRQQEFDYDIVMARFAMSMVPGESLRTLFGSQAARTNGSRNLAGVADPVIDAMIDTIIVAKSREEITVAAKVLDRLLRAGRYWIPAWFRGEHFIASWDMFERPGPLPTLSSSPSSAAMATWWVDAEKAKRLAR
ncbi:OppA ABC-type oligopeptide transport system, periplasmic component [Rhabdaerophilaceae bacterium]